MLLALKGAFARIVDDAHARHTDWNALAIDMNRAGISASATVTSAEGLVALVPLARQIDKFVVQELSGKQVGHLGVGLHHMEFHFESGLHYFVDRPRMFW